MTDNNTEKILTLLEKRLGNKYLISRLKAEKWHSFFKRLMGKVIYREDMDPKYILLKFLFILAGSYDRARMNTIKYKVDYHTVAFNNLPYGFNGLRILHLSDIHVEGIPDNGENLTKMISHLDYDLCVITGDYRFLSYGACLSTINKMKKIKAAVNCRFGTVGILGNHDSIDMVPELEAMGIRMLINESRKLVIDSDHIWIAGVDNPSFHTCASVSGALRDIHEGDFSILLAHSPGLLREAKKRRVDLYLCGHTHGGQLCLPGGRPIVTKAKCERRYSTGGWNFKGMNGYTSTGAGASGLPIRLFCPPVITVHRLIKPC